MSRFSDALLAARGDVPLFAALLAQGAGAMAAFGTSFAVEYLGGELPLMLVLVGQGLCAGVVGTRLHLARGWIPVNLLLPPAVGLVLMLRLPGWAYLAVFAAALLLYAGLRRAGRARHGHGGRSRNPRYLSSRRVKEELARLLPAGRKARFLDLGSGFGGAVLALAAKREGEFVGIESAPLPFVLSWLRVTFSGLPHARVAYGDFRTLDLAGFDLVYADLANAPMTEVFRKARAEMTPGSLFVANSFDAPGDGAGETPERTIELNDRRQSRLRVWRM